MREFARISGKKGTIRGFPHGSFDWMRCRRELILAVFPNRWGEFRGKGAGLAIGGEAGGGIGAKG